MEKQKAINRTGLGGEPSNTSSKKEPSYVKIERVMEAPYAHSRRRVEGACRAHRRSLGQGNPGGKAGRTTLEVEVIIE